MIQHYLANRVMPIQVAFHGNPTIYLDEGKTTIHFPIMQLAIFITLNVLKPQTGSDVRAHKTICGRITSHQQELSQDNTISVTASSL
jgi:hypothetical protein